MEGDKDVIEIRGERSFDKASSKLNCTGCCDLIETLRAKRNLINLCQLKFNSLLFEFEFQFFFYFSSPSLSLRSVCSRQILKRNRNTPFFLIDSYNPIISFSPRRPSKIFSPSGKLSKILFSKVERNFAEISLV